MQDLTQEDRTWGMLSHLAGFAFFVFPFGNIVGPLIIWLIKKDQSWFVNDQGKEAINFQISYSIYGIIAAALIFLLIGILLVPVVAIAWLILMILAGVKANNGEVYRYPLTIRLLK